MDVEEAELQELYMWVDEIPLSRPKRSIARDFSDGVLVAEIVKNFHPRLVDLHNYSAANGLAQKLYNWSTLNQKVFRKLNFVVRQPDCEAVATCAPGAVERVLKLLRARLEEFDAQHPAPRSALGSPRAKAVQTEAEPSGVGDEAQEELPWGEQAALLKIEEQVCTIDELRRANEALEEEVAELRVALAARDDRIASLDSRMQALAAGMKNCNIIRPARPLAERTPNTAVPLPQQQRGADKRGAAPLPRLAF